MEKVGRIKKWGDRKDLCFPPCVFGVDDGKVEGWIMITIMPLLYRSGGMEKWRVIFFIMLFPLPFSSQLGRKKMVGPGRKLHPPIYFLSLFIPTKHSINATSFALISKNWQLWM
jgi:hypothetical protein